MLADIGIGDMSKFAHIYFDSQNRQQTEYLLPKDLTMSLVTGYRADLRYRVIKRVEELEGQAKSKRCVKTLVWEMGPNLGVSIWTEITASKLSIFYLKTWP